MASSTNQPGVMFEPDQAFEEKAWAQAEADVEAGRVLDHEAVRRWLLSWVTDAELPPPAWRK
jgi:predicted transcriptional regulator